MTNTRLITGQSLSLDAYTVCAERPGLMGHFRVVGCPDDISGRYLIVQIMTTNIMNIAEVKIYGFKSN